MNKAFKAIWSDVRQSFVTTSEITFSRQKIKGFRESECSNRSFGY